MKFKSAETLSMANDSRAYIVYARVIRVRVKHLHTHCSNIGRGFIKLHDISIKCIHYPFDAPIVSRSCVYLSYSKNTGIFVIELFSDTHTQ